MKNIINLMKKARWEIPVFLITSFVALLWFKPIFSYDVVGRGDFLSPYNVVSYLIHRTNAYDLNRLFGTPATTHLAHLFTYLGFFSIFEILDLPATFATGVFYYLIVFFSSLSFLSYVRKFSKFHLGIDVSFPVKVVMVACAILFSYSPVVISLLIPGHVVLLLAYASFPYLLGVIEDINNGNDTFTTYCCVFLIYFLIAPSFSNLGVFFVHNSGLFIYTLLSILFNKKGISFLQIIKKYLFLSVISLLPNLWWLLPTLGTITSKLESAVVFSTINQFAPTSLLYSVSNMFLLKPYGIMHVDHSLAYIHESLLYNAVSSLIFILPIFVLTTIKDKKYLKYSMFLLILIVFGAYISKGYNPPFEFVFVWLYENVTVFRLFRRSVSKFYWFMYIFQMVLFTVSVLVLWKKNSKLRNVLLYGLPLVAFIHLFNYNKLYPAIYYFDIPSYLKESIAHFEKYDYKYVYIPHNYKTQPIFNDKLNDYSGRDIIDYIWEFRYVRPDMTGEVLPTFSQKELSNILYEKIHSVETENKEICEITKRMGLTHIVVRKNLMNADIDPEITFNYLSRYDIYEEVNIIGKDEDIVSFKLEENCVLGFIHSNSSDLSYKRLFGESFYIVSVGGDSKHIDLMVNFDQNWRLLPLKDSVYKFDFDFIKNLYYKHFNGEGLRGINSGNIRWNIINEKNKDSTYLIYYGPQLYFYLGLAITFVSFIVFFVAYLIHMIKSGSIYNIAKRFYNYYQVITWNLMVRFSKDKPAPHLTKRALIKKVRRETGIKTLIETGTYRGEMIAAVSDLFKKVYTIEIDETLYKNAVKRFEGNSKVTVMHGDSGKVLPKILKNLNGDLILWFDAHYSGGITGKGEKSTPIEKELDAIFKYEKKNKRKCYILIDDARCFIGKNSYPTIKAVEKAAKSHNKTFEVKDDIIRLFPKN